MKKALFCLIFAVCSFFCFGEDVFFGYDKYMTLDEIKSKTKNESIISEIETDFYYTKNIKITFYQRNCILCCDYAKETLSDESYKKNKNSFIFVINDFFTESEVWDFMDFFQKETGFLCHNVRKENEKITICMTDANKGMDIVLSPVLNKYIIKFEWFFYPQTE